MDAVSLGFIGVSESYSSQNLDKVEWAEEHVFAARHSIIADAVSRVLSLMAGAMRHANGDVGAGTGGQTRPTPASQYPSPNFAEISDCALQQC